MPATQQFGVEWWRYTDIANGVTVTVGIAGAEAGAVVHTIQDVADLPILRFGLFSDQPVRVDIQGAADDQGASFSTIFTGTCLVSTWFTTYDLPAPIGDTGAILIPTPFLRFQLTNTGPNPTTDLQFWAQATRRML